MASDASELPVTDFEAAASLPYDTDIPDGKFNKHACFSCVLLSKSRHPVLEGESQNLRLINHHFTTVSSRFFAISINIFHKGEILTVI